MQAGESLICLYQKLESLLGPRNAREALGAIIKNYLSRVHEENKVLTKQELEEFLKEQADLYN